MSEHDNVPINMETFVLPAILQTLDDDFKVLLVHGRPPAMPHCVGGEIDSVIIDDFVSTRILFCLEGLVW